MEWLLFPVKDLEAHCSRNRGSKPRPKLQAWRWNPFRGASGESVAIGNRGSKRKGHAPYREALPLYRDCIDLTPDPRAGRNFCPARSEHGNGSMILVRLQMGPNQLGYAILPKFFRSGGAPVSSLGREPKDQVFPQCRIREADGRIVVAIPDFASTVFDGVAIDLPPEYPTLARHSPGF